MGVTERARAARRRVTRPAVRSGAAVGGGATVVVVSVAQWSPVIAGILAGFALVAYGLLLVDLDGDEARRRR